MSTSRFLAPSSCQEDIVDGQYQGCCALDSDCAAGFFCLDADFCNAECIQEDFAGKVGECCSTNADCLSAKCQSGRCESNCLDIDYVVAGRTAGECCDYDMHCGADLVCL